MALDGLPNINNLHTYSDLAQTEVLDLLFESSPAIHSTLLPVMRTAVYSSYPDLIDVCQIKLLSLAATSDNGKPDPDLLSVLGSHPRLGEKKISSSQSAEEQASLNDTDDEGKLAELNVKYEENFPGLRFVTFVNGRSRRAILEELRERLDRDDFSKEVAAAIQAICDIAKDRTRKLLEKKVTILN